MTGYPDEDGEVRMRFLGEFESADGKKEMDCCGF